METKKSKLNVPKSHQLVLQKYTNINDFLIFFSHSARVFQESFPWAEPFLTLTI